MLRVMGMIMLTIIMHNEGIQKKSYSKEIKKSVDDGDIASNNTEIY